MNRQLSKAQRNLEKMLGKKSARMASNVVAVILVLVAVLLVPHFSWTSVVRSHCRKSSFNGCNCFWSVLLIQL